MQHFIYSKKTFATHLFIYICILFIFELFFKKTNRRKTQFTLALDGDKVLL